jgi:hypothetical protein
VVVIYVGGVWRVAHQSRAGGGSGHKYTRKGPLWSGSGWRLFLARADSSPRFKRGGSPCKELDATAAARAYSNRRPGGGVNASASRRRRGLRARFRVWRRGRRNGTGVSRPEVRTRRPSKRSAGESRGRLVTGGSGAKSAAGRLDPPVQSAPTASDKRVGATELCKVTPRDRARATSTSRARTS